MSYQHCQIRSERGLTAVSLSGSDVSYDDWIGALRLAVMWEFKEVDHRLF